VLTPVITATNSITTYSATLAITPDAPVLRKNSFMIPFPHKLLANPVPDFFQLAPSAGFQQWLIGGIAQTPVIREG
jgi:hypothetical protein